MIGDMISGIARGHGVTSFLNFPRLAAVGFGISYHMRMVCGGEVWAFLLFSRSLASELIPNSNAASWKPVFSCISIQLPN